MKFLLLTLLLCHFSALKYVWGTDAIDPFAVHLNQSVQLMISSQSAVSSNTFSADRFCSGFHIEYSNKIYFVTAKHCLSRKFQSYNVYYNFSGDISTQSDYKYSMLERTNQLQALGNKAVDIAVLEVSRAKIPFSTHVFKLASELPKVNDRVSIVGYLGDRGPLNFSCQYLGYRPIQKQNFVDMGSTIYCSGIEDAVQGLSGNSGGPVLNERNEVVGVLISERLSSVEGGVFKDRVIFNDLLQQNVKLQNNRLKYVSSFSNGKHFTNVEDAITGQSQNLEFNMVNGILNGDFILFDQNYNEIKRHIYLDGKKIAEHLD